MASDAETLQRTQASDARVQPHLSRHEGPLVDTADVPTSSHTHYLCLDLVTRAKENFAASPFFTHPAGRKDSRCRGAPRLETPPQRTVS